MALLFIAFALSGILLGHRDFISAVEVDRSWLPAKYQYQAWNNGIARGEVDFAGSRYIYGNAGVWVVDSAYKNCRAVNEGFPTGIDNRNVRAMTVTSSGALLALTPGGLYTLKGVRWIPVELPVAGEVLSDVTACGDTVVVTGRDHLMVSTDDSIFEAVTLEPIAGDTGHQSLFRIVLDLHSGELVGTPGRIVVDVLGVVCVGVSITGLIFLFTRRRSSFKLKGRVLKHSLRWHVKTGWYLLPLIALLLVTGWLLRPPGLIALAKTQVPMMSKNKWEDKLRATRHDPTTASWIVSTEDGFFLIKEWNDIPVKIDGAPPVSVMGVNVWHPDADGRWIVGSFSGLYRWDTATGVSTDYYTGELAPELAGAPFGGHPVGGWIASSPVEYYNGSDFAPMPAELAGQPISLWNLALEVHTGRIYTFLGPLSTLAFIFIVGIAGGWVLYTGVKLRRH